MHIYSMLSEIHFLSIAHMTKYHLRQTEPVLCFIMPDKDKIRKESSLGKHVRIAFVLIIQIIFHVQYIKERKTM